MTQNMNEITDDNIEVEAVVEAKTTEEKIAELSNQVADMQEKQTEKIADAIKHLSEELAVTATKYATATGIMAAMEAGQMLWDEGSKMADRVYVCKVAAQKMISVCKDMSEKAAKTSVDELETFLDQFYDSQFVNTEEPTSLGALLEELMVLSLCRQVGPSIQDILDFESKSDEQIEETAKQIDELKKELTEE